MDLGKYVNQQSDDYRQMVEKIRNGTKSNNVKIQYFGRSCQSHWITERETLYLLLGWQRVQRLRKKIKCCIFASSLFILKYWGPENKQLIGGLP